MDVVLIIIGLIFIVLGLAGCILPIIPGPPLSYVGLLFLQWAKHPFTKEYMIVLLLIVAAVTALDYFVSVAGTKAVGGSKSGVWGSTIGLLVGLFFAPWGIIIGPFVGAFIGELIAGQKESDAFKSAMGSLLGFLFGVCVKLAASGWITYEYFKMIIATW